MNLLTYMLAVISTDKTPIFDKETTNLKQNYWPTMTSPH